MTPPPARLTQGPVSRHLVDMTVPVLFGIFTMMAQAFADAWFIGQVGDRELAALAFAFPIIMIITSVAIGLGAGTLVRCRPCNRCRGSSSCATPGY